MTEIDPGGDIYSILVSSAGFITGTPENKDVGDHTVTVKVTDSAESDTKTFTLTVNNVNDAPEFTFTVPSSQTRCSV